jgi:hypothetical protein
VPEAAQSRLGVFPKQDSDFSFKLSECKNRWWTTTDGKAEPRINTFDACGFEMNTVNLRSFSLSIVPWSRKGPPAFHPQFGFAIRGKYQAPAFYRPVAQTIQFFGGYDDRGSRFNQGRTPPKSGSYFGTTP